MKWLHSNRSEQNYEEAPLRIQKAFDKQAHLLAANLLHPLLHAKKFDESGDTWQARVNKDWRFYFQIEDDTYIVVRIVPHPK